jgi:hypothetical protein
VRVVTWRLALGAGLALGTPLALDAPLARAQAPTRPRMTAALGMGASFDATGLPQTKAIPAFFATGGVGADWPVGVELAAFASSAQGRFGSTSAPVDRLALAAVSVVRPFAWKVSVDDRSYHARFVRAAAVELGLGLERDSTTVRAGSRYGLHTGARLEFPLELPGFGSELRLRLAARRMQGFYTPRVQETDVGNSLELFAALVTVF